MPSIKPLLLVLVLSGAVAGCGHNPAADGTNQPMTPTGSGTSLSDRPLISRSKPDLPASVRELHQLLVGDWLGHQRTRDGGTVSWIMRRSGDGMFRITFRNRDAAGRTSESTEVGRWGVSGNILMAQTVGWLEPGGKLKEAPADDPYFWDAYVLLRVTRDTLHYQSVESKNEYHVTRVPVGSGFPE